jgi:hypothetical protein
MVFAYRVEEKEKNGQVGAFRALGAVSGSPLL